MVSFFARTSLPLLTSTRQVIEALDNDIMELDEAAAFLDRHRVRPSG